MSSKDYRVGMTRLADCPNSLQDDMICAIDLGGDSTVDRETSYNRAVGLFKYILQQRKSDIDGRSQSSATVQYHKDMLALTRKMVKYLELMTGEVEDNSAPPVNLSGDAEDSQLANLAAMLDKLGVARNNVEAATQTSTNNAEESQKKPAKKARKPKSSKSDDKGKDRYESNASTSDTAKNGDNDGKGGKSDSAKPPTRSDADILDSINNREYENFSDEDKLKTASDDFKTVHELCKSKQHKNKAIHSLFHQLDKLCKKFDTHDEKLRATLQTQYAKHSHYFHTLNKWAYAAFDPKRPGLAWIHPNKVVQGLYTFTLWYGLAQRDDDEIFSTVDIMESDLNSWIEHNVKDIEGNYLENSYIYPRSCNDYELGDTHFSTNMLDLHGGNIPQIFNATTLSYLWMLHRFIKFDNTKLQIQMDSFFKISLNLFRSTIPKDSRGLWFIYGDLLSDTTGSTLLLIAQINDMPFIKCEDALQSSTDKYMQYVGSLKSPSQALSQYLDK